MMTVPGNLRWLPATPAEDLDFDTVFEVVAKALGSRDLEMVELPADAPEADLDEMDAFIDDLIGKARALRYDQRDDHAIYVYQGLAFVTLDNGNWEGFYRVREAT